MKYLILPFFILLFTSYAFAEETRNPCANYPKISGAEAIECLGYKYDLIDKEMNIQYQKAIAHIKKSPHEPKIKKKWENKLRLAQKKWIEYRDCNCDEAGYLYYPGTGMDDLYMQCMIKTTKERIEHFTNYF